MGLIDKLRGKMEDAQIKVLDIQEKINKNLVDKQTDAFEKQQQYKQDLINKQNERRRSNSDVSQSSNTEKLLSLEAYMKLDGVHVRLYYFIVVVKQKPWLFLAR